MHNPVVAYKTSLAALAALALLCVNPGVASLCGIYCETVGRTGTAETHATMAGNFSCCSDAAHTAIQRPECRNADSVSALQKKDDSASLPLSPSPFAVPVEPSSAALAAETTVRLVQAHSPPGSAAVPSTIIPLRI